MSFYTINKNSVIKTHNDNLIQRINNGEIIIYKGALHELGFFEPIYQAYIGAAEKIIGKDQVHKLADLGIEKSHLFLDGKQIRDIYRSMRVILADIMPYYVKVIIHKILNIKQSYIHKNSLIRLFVPHKILQENIRDFSQYLGKLDLHGPHHDFYQNVTVNAVNLWMAVGNVQEGNGISIFPDVWGQTLPMGKDHVAHNQYIGEPINVVCEPGDILFFHAHHMHSSVLNTTDETRIVLTNRFTPDEPIYPSEEAKGDYYLSDEISENGISNKALYTPISKKVASHFDYSNRSKISVKGWDAKPVDMLENNEITPVDKKRCAVKIANKVHYISRYCTHIGADLSLGYVKDNRVYCPWHNVSFDPQTGKSNCEALRALKTFKSLDDNHITEEPKKVAYFNCTGTQPHIGCLAVTDSHMRSLLHNGYQISSIYTVSETTQYRRETRDKTVEAILKSFIPRDIENADAVIINGEGTIHHQRGTDLLCIAKIAKDMGKRVFLVNAVIQEMEGWFDILSNLDDLNVRDTYSAEYLKKNNVPHRLVLDSFLDADFSNQQTYDFRHKLLITDWHPARDKDVGKTCRAFIESHRNRSLFVPFHHWSYIENNNWAHQILNFSTAEAIITGRHHGVYASILTGKPFVALPSNTYKVEGMVSYCNNKIPFCEHPVDLEKKLEYALGNPSLFMDMKDYILSHKPLGTFDVLYKIVPSKNEKTSEDINCEIRSLNENLYKKALEDELLREDRLSLARLRNATKIEDLTRQNLLHKEKLHLQREKTQELKSSYADKISLKSTQIEAYKEKMSASKAAYANKIEELKSQLLNYKNIIREERIAHKNNKNIELAKLCYANKDYINSQLYAVKGLKIDPYNETLISILFRSEAVFKVKNIAFKHYGQKHIGLLESQRDDGLKFAALAKSYCLSHNYDKALIYFDLLSNTDILSNEQQYEYASSLHAVSRLNDAKFQFEKIVNDTLETSPKDAISAAKQLGTIYNRVGEHQKVFELAKKIEKAIKEINSEEIRPVYMAYLGTGQLEQAWDRYLYQYEVDAFANNFKQGIEYFKTTLRDNISINTLVIANCGGVGDEIRHISLYQDILNLSPRPPSNIVIACDARLQSLLQRSYPEINFMPVSRNYVGNPRDTKLNVPDSLKPYFNDDLYEIANKADVVLHSYSLMRIFRNSYEKFQTSKRVTLQADNKLRRKWRQRLDLMGQKIKVGINKGSHLSGTNRTANSIDYSQWSEILALEGVDFINLSFHITDDEKRLKNLHHFSDIDLRDDMENAAALISELDMVITPPNMVVDFSGALGVKTLCLYSTNEYNWRFIDSDKTDIWHTNVCAVKGDHPCDKTNLMEKTRIYLSEYIKSKTQSLRLIDA